MPKSYQRDIGKLLRIRERRFCHDDRPYNSVPFTITGDVVAQNYEPMWRVDRNYYIASVTATCGLHLDATHPLDGTPHGGNLKVNMRRITADLQNDDPILASDNVLDIAEDAHRDEANRSENEFAILKLTEGESVYVRVVAIGSERAGRNLVVTITLVPER